MKPDFGSFVCYLRLAINRQKSLYKELATLSSIWSRRNVFTRLFADRIECSL